MLNDLMQHNVEWPDSLLRSDPSYFSRLAQQQTPEFFWIRCSDSRVPASVVAGLAPGEVFLHRNVANVVHSSDINLLSTLEFAVDALNLREIIVCEHYGCDGIRAAMEDLPYGTTDHWLAPIRRLARACAVDLAQSVGTEAHHDKLAELNVIEGVGRVSETPIVQRAWSKGADLRVYGLIYGLKDGRNADLDCSTGPGHFRRAASK